MLMVLNSHFKKSGYMKSVKARAHSNIALVKYWGKRDIPLNLPAVASISITLDALYTDAEIVFNTDLAADTLNLNNESASEKDRLRLSRFLDLIRSRAGINACASVKSENNFPTSAGLASSASSFACLALAASSAAGLILNSVELSILARLGSGSAARSVFGGFVEMNPGNKKDGSDAAAYQLYPENYWDLTVIIAITSEQKKKTGSTDGMEISRLTSPYYDAWVNSSQKDMEDMRSAIKNKDFQKMAEVSEFSCLKMHALALASNPGLIYWNGTTIDLLHKIKALRERGLPVFFTVDAGPQVKAICPFSAAEKVKSALYEIEGVSRIIQTGLGSNARIMEEKWLK